MTKLTLKVINLWAGPGAGKSTLAAGLFNAMKSMGLRVELVTEYAKDLTYEKNYGTLQNQFLVAAKQDSRLRRLEGQVEWAVADSPLPLAIAYATPEYDEWLSPAIIAAYRRYVNYDFFVRRKKPYMGYGRTQTEHQALAIDITLRDIFNEYAKDQCAVDVTGDSAGVYKVLKAVGLRDELEDCFKSTEHWRP
jgi:hypothetical protein